MMPVLLFLCAAAPAPRGDGDFYRVEHLPVPAGERFEVGGLGFLPDGRLAISTRRGQVWIYSDPLASESKQARATLFAEGLQEGLGLAVVDGKIWVLQRAELSRLHDDDGDGRCDRLETLASDWGVSGNYHEFAFGLPRDEQGSAYLSLNVAFADPWWLGISPVPWRGWVLRVDRAGTVLPFASGFRSPCGIGRDMHGRLLVTDNQGDWMAACGLFHVREGRFYGHPASLRWTREYQASGKLPDLEQPTDRPREDAAIWIPYDWSRSAGDMASDESGGKFGPFAGQLFLAEMTNGRVLRAELEELDGVTQGVVHPFQSGVGSAIRLAFAPDGSLFCGLTDRGWGGQAPGDGVARLRWNGRTPFEVRSVKLVPGGFRLEFTEAVAVAGISPANVRAHQYDYDYWWEYGSPLRNVTPREVTAVELASDRRSALLRVAGLTAGKVARVKLTEVRSERGEPLRHGEFAYTVRRLADDPKVVGVTKVNSVPPPREAGDEGVLLLCQDEPMDVWSGRGWSRGGVSVDVEAPEKLVRTPEEEVDRKRHQGRILSNAGAAAENLTSKLLFGDVDLSFRFLLPKGSDSGLFLMGRYEIDLRDDAALCGALPPGASGAFAGRPSEFRVYRGPGEWHELSARFQAPRFDEHGRKVANARLLRVLVDDTLVHEEIELPGPTQGAPLLDEAAEGPLVVQGDRGPVAIRGLRVRLRNQYRADGAWQPLFEQGALDAWTAGALVTPRSDWRQFELRGRLKLGGQTSGALRLLAREGGGAGDGGYVLPLDLTATGAAKLGSIADLAPLGTQLVMPDLWLNFSVRCTEEAGGTRLIVRLNDVIVRDVLDLQRRFGPGAIALEHGGAQSQIHWKDLQIRELPLAN
jgi:glucose/arabinose dehydrogenase